MNIEIANRLVELRRARGYSQESLAAALGVSRQAVSKWERAESAPDTDNLIALARLYDVSLDSLLLHSAGGGAAAAPAPEPESQGADPEAEETARIFAAARAWDAVEQEARKKRRAAFNWVLTLVLMIGTPLAGILLGLDGIYAVAVVIVYLVSGFLAQNWHPGWLLYLTIPIFYYLN